jgi:5-formyltetrahydrofolate cyclo-ligase
LREAKLALRQRTLSARDALPPGVRTAASDAIAARILADPEFTRAKAVLLTLPFRSEWDTLPLVRATLTAGKTVAIPRVDMTTRMLDLHTIADPDRDVGAGHRGIPEPRLHCPRIGYAAIDFVLVPGVAFDRCGRRLGYGGGYYDRLLPLFSPRVARVAGAFELQLVDRVPAAPHDIAVDAIFTESRMLAIRQ